MTSYRGSKYLHHSYGRIHQCKMDLQSTHPGRRARSSMNPCSRCSTCSASSDTYIPRSPMAPMRRQPSPTVATDDATTHVRRAGTNRHLYGVLKKQHRRCRRRRSIRQPTRNAGTSCATRRPHPPWCPVASACMPRTAHTRDSCGSFARQAPRGPTSVPHVCKACGTNTAAQVVPDVALP